MKQVDSSRKSENQQSQTLKENYLHLSAAALKWIALLSMTADHIAVILKPIFGFREFGNLAFPLFAFLLAEGFFYTKNRRAYKIRLLFTAVISELPYDLAFSGHIIDLHRQNVCLTLLIAFVAMDFLECYGNGIWEKIVTVAVFCTFAEATGADGGAWGVLLILIFYLCEKSNSDKKKIMKAVASAVVSIVAWHVSIWIAALILLCLLIYDGAKGRMKYRSIFYIYYPVHLLILHVISKFL